MKHPVIKILINRLEGNFKMKTLFVTDLDGTLLNRKIKRVCNCDKLICFGDGANDVSMFQVSDECYAVENAIDELKHLATDIIASNDEDGVAKWIQMHSCT